MNSLWLIVKTWAYCNFCMKIRPALLCCFLVLISFNHAETDTIHTDITGKVIAVKDGDTIDVLVNNKKVTVRLAHIDCPEMGKGQPFGAQAKKFTSAKCFGQIVTVQNKGSYDRYRRLIGVVINRNKENVNMELVKAGLAWYYAKYSSNISYRDAERVARRRRKGIWSEEKPTPPWQWRKPATKKNTPVKTK